MLQSVPYILIALFALWVVIETYVISVSNVDVYLPDIPDSFDGFRIVQLSDIHGRRLTPGGQTIRKIRDAAPDLIAVTGDFVHKSSDEMAKVSPFVASLCEIAPVYAVGGNHDYNAGWPVIAQELKKAGAIVLENEGVLFSHGNDDVLLGGVHDPYSKRDCLERVLSQRSGKHVFMLAHAPSWFEPAYKKHFATAAEYSKHKARLAQLCLTLTGHTHGGQVKLPILGAITTGKGKWFPRRYVEGLFKEGTGWLYINRGLGQGWPLPLRFRSRPEVAVLIIRKQYP